MADLLPIEVFAAGTYQDVAGRDVTFTPDDLDQIVANFEALREQIRPPVKLGHDSTQILGGQRDGMPALGWVARLQRLGSKLVAHLSDVPDIVRDLIAAKKYRRVSAEFHLNFAKSPWEANLKSGVQGKVLEAVALLGADLPQVATLQDLSAYLSTALPDATFTPSDAPGSLNLLEPQDRVACLSRPGSPAPSEPMADDTKPAADAAKDDTMADDVKAELAALRAQLATLTAEKAEREAAAAGKDDAQVKLAEQSEHERIELRKQNEALAARVAAMEAEAEAERGRRRAQEAEQYVAALSTAENLKVLPAQRVWLTALHRKLAGLEDIVLDAGEAATLGIDKQGGHTLLSLLDGFVNARPADTHLVTASATMPFSRPGSSDNFEDELKRIAGTHQLNLSVPAERSKASLLLVQERPELAGVNTRRGH